jgi:cellulose 1,4-beta-cellobiosidase
LAPGDKDNFTKHGGFKQLEQALGKGMVLVLSLWDDHDVNMLWFGSVYPTNKKRILRLEQQFAGYSGD